MLCKDTHSNNPIPVFFDCNRNNSERNALLDSENVEDGTQFSRVNINDFCANQNTILAACKGHCLTLLKTIVAATKFVKMRLGRRSILVYIENE